MKERKFLIFGLAVFFAFLLIGKYFQENALSSTNVIYSTHVIRKTNQEEVIFQVQRTVDNTYLIRNATTGEVSSADTPQSLSQTHIRISLPNDEGTLELRQSIIPWKKPTLTIQRSDVYRQIENSSEVITANGYSIENGDALATPSVSGTQEISLSDNDITKIAKQFAKWLYDSHYGEDAVVVRGQFDAPLGSANTAEAWYVNTSDGEILTRVVGADTETVSELNQLRIGAETLSGDEALLRLENFPLTQLGLFANTDKVSDLSPKTVIRLYYLKDRFHANYDTEAEKNDLIASKVPSSEQVAYRYNGYTYLYEELVDTSQESMQIILASNGKVYYVTNYWLPGYQIENLQTYELAPSDMQATYQNLLVESNSSPNSTSSSSN